MLCLCSKIIYKVFYYLLYYYIYYKPCTLAPLASCTSAPLHPCTLAPLASCTSGALHPCTSGPLHPCASGLLHLWSLAPLHPSPPRLHIAPPPPPGRGWRSTLKVAGNLASVRTLSELNQRSEHTENQMVVKLNGLRKYICRRT